MKKRGCPGKNGTNGNPSLLAGSPEHSNEILSSIKSGHFLEPVSQQILYSFNLIIIYFQTVAILQDVHGYHLPCTAVESDLLL
jgi:hypothetical protein